MQQTEVVVSLLECADGDPIVEYLELVEGHVFAICELLADGALKDLDILVECFEYLVVWLQRNVLVESQKLKCRLPDLMQLQD